MMRKSLRCTAITVGIGIMMQPLANFASAADPALPAPSGVAEDGTVSAASAEIPYSDLASEQQKRSFIERRGRPSQSPTADATGGTAEEQVKPLRVLAEDGVRASLARLRVEFPVRVLTTRIGGVTVDIITPLNGIATANRHRLLISLHGGGMIVGGLEAGQQYSIPVAVLGGFKVISIDYRMAPESHYPAASEDVANVYTALLKSYRAENIGIYGCSSGADLAAQSVAWFGAHGLPRPGAIGMFGSGAAISDHWGDSNYFAALLTGGPVPTIPAAGQWSDEPANVAKDLDYLSGANLNDPLVTPAYSRKTLARFPPALLLSGTRDPGLSAVLYTHEQLVDVGVDAELHVWEGADHCAPFSGTVDPTVPETRQAWNVMVRFFTRHLGTRPAR
jgi:epsilon-lactone hydrolase